MKKLICLLPAFLLCLCGSNLLSIAKADPEYYQDRTKLEAEDVFSGTKINNPHASKQKLIDLGDSNEVSFHVNIETNTTYDLLIGYFSGSANPKIKVQVDSESPLSHTLGYDNGWGDNSNNYVSEELIEGFTLTAGEHDIKIISDNSGDSKYVNLDYIYLNHSRFQADGCRIQAEDCYKLGHSVEKEGGNCVDGTTLSVDAEADAKPTWKISVPEAGTYTFQVACFTGHGATPTYRFNFLQSVNTPYDLELIGTEGDWDRHSYSSKSEFNIDLEAGELELSYQYLTLGYADFDWFRLFKVTPTIGEKILAEDHVFGDVNLMKSPSNYPFLTAHAAEIAKGRIEFDVSAGEAGDYDLYINGFTGTPGAYLKLDLNGDESNLVVPSFYATGWIESVSEKNLIPFTVSLQLGNNHFIITKGDDSLSMNYIDVDYLLITRTKIDETSIHLDFETHTSFDLKTIIHFVPEYTLTLSDPSVISISSSKIITPLKHGTCTISVDYQLDGIDFNKQIRVDVDKPSYPMPEQLKGFDTTKEYDGTVPSVDVSMPDGWTCQQSGASSMVGNYVVTLTFSHPDYRDVVKPGAAILTITKGTYRGSDLYADDMRVAYDGEPHTLMASAPDGWTITYSKSDLIEPGTYDIEVTFSHPGYNPVVKTAKLTIYQVKKNNTGAIVVAVVVPSVIVIGVAAFFIIKKIKESQEVIK